MRRGSAAAEPPLLQHAFSPPHERAESLTAALERDHPFSWRRCFFSVLAYALLLSDTIRGGLAIRDLHGFTRLEPDALLLGPYAYRVAELTRSPRSDGDQAPSPLRSWPYKYDTTSVTMRAVAQLLDVDAWPPCVLYQSSDCDHRVGLSRATVFAMLDALVERVRLKRELSLRSEHALVDRLRDRVLPWGLRRRLQRSSHALYLSALRLKAPICSRRRDSPLACDAPWLRFERLCGSPSAFCNGVRDVWADVAARLAQLQRRHANATLDLLVLEGTDDPSRGGMLSHGYQHFDLVTLARVRVCASSSPPPASCETLVVQDFRYEGVVLVTSAIDWAAIISALRIAGQAYVWLRLLCLVVGVVSAQAPNATARSVLRTLFLVPSQVVIYGSMPPIACYVAAHLLDASIEYAFVANLFTSPLGVFRLRLEDALRAGAVSLRCVWIVAIVCHAAVALAARRPSWSPATGVRGVSGFFIALLAAPSVLAQLRSTEWRDTRVLHVLEVPSSPRRFRLRTDAFDNASTPLFRLALGTTLDLQMLLGTLAVFALAWLALHALHRRWPDAVRYAVVFSSRTLVPYSAGALWPPNALVVGWSGLVVARLPPPARPRTRRRLRLEHSMSSALRASQRFQTDLAAPAQRSAVMASFVAVVHLAVLSDPWTLGRLWGGGASVPLGVFRSRAARCTVVLPLALRQSDADVPIDWDDWELLTTRAAQELSWCELLTCG
ncbi:hypothetical protein ATCC90586_000333 [Pythium insidiosum]|nr:hypothetical protein ATCC90586_000333 [Pythium insidiosum]